MTFIALLPALYAEDAPVAKIQETLKAQSFYFGDVNGQMDDATRAGLRRYQIRYGLPATGVADPATIASMTGAPGGPQKAEPDKSTGAVAERPKKNENDRTFLEEVEKDETRLTGKTVTAPPTPVQAAPPAAPAKTVERAEPPTKAQPAREVAETQRPRNEAVDAHAHVVPRRQEPAGDGVLDSRGVAVQTFQNRAPQQRDPETGVVEIPAPTATEPELAPRPRRPVETPAERVVEAPATRATASEPPQRAKRTVEASPERVAEAPATKATAPEPPQRGKRSVEAPSERVVEAPAPRTTAPESQRPKRTVDTPTERVAETRKPKEAPAAPRGGFHKEGEEPEAVVAEGPTESTGVRTSSNREFQPSSPANTANADTQSPGVAGPYPKGTNVTTTTTKYTDANGWVHTIKRTTVTEPKPRKQWKLFGPND